MTRSDRIPLPAEEPRCEPPQCAVRARCARAMAAIPQRGAIVGDYQSEPGAGTALCTGFLLVDLVRRAAMAKPAARPAAKPWPGTRCTDCATGGRRADCTTGGAE